MATTNTNQQQEGAGSVPAKRKPVFVKVNDLKPGTKGHNLTVKVVSSTTVLDKKSIRNSGNTRIAECLIGDDTASILFTARNNQGLDFYPPPLFFDNIVSGFCALRRNGTRKARIPDRVPPMLLQKPAEPDFTAEDK